MTERDLAAEIVAVLSTGEHTMLAIARQVRARNQDVIDHVRVLEAAGRVYQAEGPDGRHVYGLASAPTGRSGNSISQADRVLAILADGEPHMHHEFYGWCVLHSRISDLRKRGHVIHAWHENHVNGRRYWYQLLASPSAEVPLTDGEGSGDSPVSLGNASAVGPASRRAPTASSSVSGSVLDEQGFIPGGSSACHAGAHDDGATGKGLAASIEPLQLSIGEAA